ncbi:MAG: MoaD/ThiS family protein [Acidimicrobiales bacterium]|nr:MoaD/ThiS family protein [Acidimicrobiales bacterium]
MSITVRVPTTLRPLTGGSPDVSVEAATVGEAMAALESAHPGFNERIFDDQGALRRFVNVFVSDEDIRFLEGLDTSVPEGATVAIIPAVAGG